MSHFEEETICDLFSEQSLLCSLLPYSIRYAFEALSKNNINKEMALSECLVESRLILNTIEQVGFEKFFDVISPNAFIGGQKAVNTKEFQSLRILFDRLLNDISTKKFYEEVSQTNLDSLRSVVTSDWRETEICQNWKKVFEQK